MIRKEICEALYALPDGVVLPRRRSVVCHIVIALVGVAVLLANFLFVTNSASTLSMLLVVVGGALVLYGAVVAMMRLASGDKVPYHTVSKSYMQGRERFYSRDNLAELREAVAMHDVARIDKVPTSSVSALTLVECRSKDGALLALALYEYVEYEDRLMGDVVIVRR